MQGMKGVMKFSEWDFRL